MPKGDAAARWRELLDEFTSGRESVAEFCARRGVATPTFYQWRRRLAGGAPAEGRAPFIRVDVVQQRSRASTTTSGGGVEVVLGGGRRLRLERGFDPAVLTAAVAALEGIA